jgi:glycerophosphoryl diester phosphodiesterase
MSKPAPATFRPRAKERDPHPDPAVLLAAGLPAASAEAKNRWLKPKAINIAHQGGEDEFPSNTLYAFHKAVTAGADMLELDIGVTKDGKVIVMHDTTVDGKTNGHGNVSSLTLRQIKRLDAAYWFAPKAREHYSHDLARKAYRFRGIATGMKKAPKGYRAADFRVPTLSEVLRAFPKTPINLEIKGRTPAEADAEYIHDAEGARPSAQAHEAQGPDRGLLQAARGRPLPRAAAARRHGTRHHRSGDLDPERRQRLPRRRRRGVPGADHLPAWDHNARHHHEGERRPRALPGLRLAVLVLRR